MDYISGWWARATPLKNMTSSIGMMRFPIYGKIKNGNQTTNQIWMTTRGSPVSVGLIKLLPVAFPVSSSSRRCVSQQPARSDGTGQDQSKGKSLGGETAQIRSLHYNPCMYIIYIGTYTYTYIYIYGFILYMYIFMYI